METLTNAVNTASTAAVAAADAASKVIWGDNTANVTQSGTEPVSGLQGSGTASEPFDMGNEENTANQSSTLGSSNPDSSTTGSNDPASTTSSSSPTTSTSGPSSSSANTTDPAPSTSTPSTSKPTTDPAPSTSTPSTSKPTTALDSGMHDPSTGADPKSGQAPTEKDQGAERPTEEPLGEQTDAIRSDKEKTENAMGGDDDDLPKDIKRDPNDHSGELMRDHGADEGKDKEEKKEGKEGGGPLGGESKEKGTGEQWVKTSGMAAEGGDFDATKPGAAKEADRLLEEKGVHRDGPNQGPPETEDGKDPLDPANKKSMGSKIKEKLHIGHGHKEKA